jgi:type II secretory pathway component PulC
MNMKMIKKTWLPTVSFALALGSMIFGLSAHSLGQDKDKDEAKAEKKTRIRIIDRDGRELQPSVVPAEPLTKDGKFAGNVQITNENGVITIRDAEGNEQTINAASVIVSQSQKTTVENGEEKTEVVKKAIVVDADGKTYEIDLSNGGQIGTPQGPVIITQGNLGKFMIGVVAQPVSEALAEQMNLEPATGLVIQQVTPGSAAAEAELKENDILLYADQQALKSVEELVQAVQKAGEEKTELNLTVVRDDKEISVSVKPQLRKMGMFNAGPGGMEAFRMLDPNFGLELGEMGDLNFGWAQAGPGVVFDARDFDPEALKAQVEKMREQHRLHLDRMKEAFERQREARGHQVQAAEDAAASRDQMKELREEVKRLREEIESLKKEKN